MLSGWEEIARRIERSSLSTTSESSWVTAAFAQSIDGALALEPGRPTRFSSEQSLEMTHSLRASHDAIVVGSGTIIADDPQLNVRLADSRQNPRRIVLDRRLRISASARLLTSPGGEVFVITSKASCTRRCHELEAAGAQVLRWPMSDFTPMRIRRRLRELGIRRMMLEGGARLIANFFAHASVNYAVITISPVLSVCSNAVRYGCSSAAKAVGLGDGGRNVVGNDVVVDGPIIDRASAQRSAPEALLAAKPSRYDAPAQPGKP